MQPHSENSFLTANQAANILNVSLSTLKKLIRQDKIKTFQTPGGHYRILKSDLLEDLRRHSLASRSAQMAREMDSVLLESIHALMSVIESRQKFGRGHAASVAQISREIAAGLKFSDKQTEKVIKASLLHDIGMINVPEGILNKTKPLSAKDHEVLRSHPLSAAQWLAGFPMFADAAPIIEQHHERFDGRGYPHGLKGDAICLEAKIIALAESFISMTADDSYKKPKKLDEALDDIQQSAGSQFDPVVVNAFLQRAESLSLEKAGR